MMIVSSQLVASFELTLATPLAANHFSPFYGTFENDQ